MTSRRVRVRLGERSYDAIVGEGLLRGLGPRVRRACATARRALLVEDRGVPARTRDAAADSLARAGLLVRRVPLAGGEGVKSPRVLERLLAAAADARLDRDDPIVSLGGGAVGDVAGLAAATYRRGTPWINCPTTLLAMVDAGVGGKTGVNLATRRGLLKNAAGCFHQPRLVVCDVAALRSLPRREFSAGLAECLKHALIARSTPRRDPSLLARTDGLLARPANRPTITDPLAALIARNVALKAGVVEHDEFERRAAGGRVLLNLGHTFAHAAETLAGLRTPAGRPLRLLHGEAVGLGLIAAANSAATLGLCPATLPASVAELVGRAGLPTRVAGLPSAAVLRRRMLDDKKSRGGVLRLILPLALGVCEVVAAPPARAIDAGWDAVRA
jgi:3-dehydroquinate synthetase